MYLTLIRYSAIRMLALASPAVGGLPGGLALDWFEDLANSLTDSLSKARVDIVKQMAVSALPSAKDLESDWYTLGLGGAYGLATKLIMLILVLVALVMALTPLSSHGLRVRRTVSRFLIVGIFGSLFYPLYGLAYEGIIAFQQGMVSIATAKEGAKIEDAWSTVVEVSLPTDVWLKLMVAAISLGFTYCAYGLTILNYLGVLVTAMFYPLAAAVSPIGEKFNQLFHVANSMLITTMLTPLIISGGFLLPEYASKALPGIGARGFTAGILVVVGSVVAFVGPIMLAVYAFKGSEQVFGRLDFASISGSIDVNSMPPVSSSDMDTSVKESAGKAFLGTLGAGAATAQLSKSDDLLGDIKKLGIEAAGAAATAAGHPYVGAALAAVDTTLSREKRKHAAEAQQSPSASPSPPPLHEVSETPATPPQATMQSPITEWPDKK